MITENAKIYLSGGSTNNNGATPAIFPAQLIDFWRSPSLPPIAEQAAKALLGIAADRPTSFAAQLPPLPGLPSQGGYSSGFLPAPPRLLQQPRDSLEPSLRPVIHNHPSGTAASYALMSFANDNNRLSSRRNAAKKTRGNLPRAATMALRNWLGHHLRHPYPSEEEKEMLARQNGISTSQVSNWFINARRRHLQPAEGSSSLVLRDPPSKRGVSS